MDYLDREFLLQGIRQGFHFAGSVNIHGFVSMNNQKSAQGTSKIAVDEQILQELHNGHDRVVDTPADITSPLGAIPAQTNIIQGATGRGQHTWLSVTVQQGIL